MKIRPLFDRVVVLVDKKEDKTKSGIILQNNESEKSLIGKVISVGNGIAVNNNFMDMQLKVGDRVLFSKFGASEIVVEDIKYLVLRQTDVLAVIED